MRRVNPQLLLGLEFADVMHVTDLLVAQQVGEEVQIAQDLVEVDRRYGMDGHLLKCHVVEMILDNLAELGDGNAVVGLDAEALKLNQLRIVNRPPDAQHRDQLIYLVYELLIEVHLLRCC